ncbi:MAG TPA: Ppx/GppA phosphatase family protein [Gemmatimonadaceae bacterium]|nr:Ppx/GppA phosphatase family protein [Gemmatimonadaceae bacterium]
MTAPRLRLGTGDAPQRAPGDAGWQRIAAIDVGSNSIRQIIADVGPSGAIRIVDEMKAAPRLAAGLGRKGMLSEDAMARATDALARMAELARQLGARRIEAVATSAVREAKNGAAFLARVRQQAGLRVRVLVGEEEARLAYRSALAHFELGKGRAVVVDIGGGSVELALAAEGLVDRLITLPFGAVRMTERFFAGRTAERAVRKLRKHVRPHIERALPLRDWRGADVIGSGGTFTNLAGIYLARQGMRAARSVHGTRIPRAEVDAILDMLAALPVDQRVTVPGLNEARADIIVAGLAVIAEVIARVEPPEVAASAFGIREGLLLETARVMPSISDPGEARERSVREFAERCHYEAPHARQVQRLALQLFDAMGARLGLDASDRAILSDAALLHDIGYHINYQGHHKHSYHLILHADLLGIAPEEQVVVAHVARYHRGAAPSRAKHKEFADLDRAVRRRVRRLAALLRIADGLDRGHVAAVERARVRWLGRAIRITPVPSPRARSLRLELWGAARKAGLLERVAGVPVELVGADGKPVRTDDATPAGDAG